MDSKFQKPRGLAVVCVAGERDAGTAHLAALLDGAPEIVSAGWTDRLRPAVLRSETCSCGSAVSDCPFWTRVLAGLAVRSHGLPRAGLFAGTGAAPEETGERTAAFAAALLDVSGKRMALFSTSDPAHLAALAGNPAFDLWVVHAAGGGRGWRSVRRVRRLRPVLDGLPAGKRLDLDSGDLLRDAPEAAGRVRSFLGLRGDAAAPDAGVERHVPGGEAGKK